MTATIHKNNYKKGIKKVCIFCIFLHAPKLPDYILHYIKHLGKLGYETIVVSHSEIQEEDLETLSPLCCGVVVKENIGYDFFAWKFGMDLVDNVSEVDSLLLVNDSVIGPFNDLSEIFAQMSVVYDFWGLTENLEHKYHIQSYFLCANKKVLKSKQWKSFWQSLQLYEKKIDIVRNYEIKLTQTLLKNKDIKIGAWVAHTKIALRFPPSQYVNYPKSGFWYGFSNPTVRHWMELLIYFDFPFIKKNLFFDKEHYHYVYDNELFVYKVQPVNWKNTIEEKYGLQASALVLNLLDSVADNSWRVERSFPSTYKVLLIFDRVKSSGQIAYLKRWIDFYKIKQIETELIVADAPALQGLFDSQLRNQTKITILSALTRREHEKLKQRFTEEHIGTIVIGDLASAKHAQYFSYLRAPHILITNEEHVEKALPTDEYNFKLHSPCVVSPVVNISLGRITIDHIIHQNVGISNCFFESSVPEISLLGLSDFIQKKEHIISLIEVLKQKGLKLKYNLFFNLDEYHVIEELIKVEPQLITDFETQLDCSIVKYENFSDCVSTSSKKLFISYFNENYLADECLQCLFADKLMLFHEDSFPFRTLVNNDSRFLFNFQRINELADVIENFILNKELYKLTVTQQKELLKAYLQKLKVDHYRHLLLNEIIDFTELRRREPLITVIFHFHFYSFDEISFINYKKKLIAFSKPNISFLFSITEDSYEIQKHTKILKETFPGCVIKIVPNKGRDIGAKFLLFDYLLKTGSKAELIVVLHDKKSLHLSFLEATLWIDSLLKIIDPSNYRTIVSCFQNDSSLGIVGSAEKIIDSILMWNNDNGCKVPVFERNNDLLHNMIVEYNINITDYSFVGGTMFWIRTDLLRALDHKYNFIKRYKELEDGNVMDDDSATKTHSWERLICWLSTNIGYKVGKI